MTEAIRVADLMGQLSLTTTDLARIYSHLGDPADIPSISRRIRRRLVPGAEATGETIAFLNLLLHIEGARRLLGKALSKDEGDGCRRSRKKR